MKSQLDWDTFYLKIADLIAQQSYAEDRKVGALLVKDDNIISFSYNGTPPKTNNDTQTNIVLHAEAQAISKVARSTSSTVGSTLYCTLSPCIDCAKLIFSVGIKRVVYRDNYKCLDGVEFLRKVGVGINQTLPQNSLADPAWLAKTGLN
jgi:dCMP deaminase